MTATNTKSTSIGRSPHVPSTAPVRLAVPEAAEMLGVHPNTLRRYLASGELRSVRVGGRVFVPEGAVEDYLAARTAGGPA